MRKLKVMIAVTALACSTAASAMPEQVPGKWWNLMTYRLDIMADNPGFCGSNNAASWICFYY